MQSSSSSLSSCVRNVFFQRGPLLRKVKKAFSKGPKKTKKRSRRFDFFAEKVLLWKRRRPVVSYRTNDFFPFFFFLFFRNDDEKKMTKKIKTKGRRRRFESKKKRETLLFLSLSLSKNEGIQKSSSLSRNVFVTQKNDTLYSKILSLIKRLCIKTGWIRAPRSRFGPREKHEKHPD